MQALLNTHGDVLPTVETSHLPMQFWLLHTALLHTTHKTEFTIHNLLLLILTSRPVSRQCAPSQCRLSYMLDSIILTLLFVFLQGMALPGLSADNVLLLTAHCFTCRKLHSTFTYLAAVVFLQGMALPGLSAGNVL
jgi:hypothetical protein